MSMPQNAAAPGGTDPTPGGTEQQVLISPAPQGPARKPGRSPQRLISAVAGVVLGLLGASGRLPLSGGAPFPFLVLGIMITPSLTALVATVLSRPSGLAVLWTSVGVGRWAASTVWRGRLIAVRWLVFSPFSACLLIVDRPRLRLRLWLGVAAGTLAQFVAGAALVVSASPGAVLCGWGVIAMTVLLSCLKAGTVSSRAWILFRLPFGDQHKRLSEWVHDPASLAAAAALAAGRVDAAGAALAAAEPSQHNRRRWAQVAVALAEGRFDEAARGAYELSGRTQAPALRLGLLVMYATAMADAVAAGHWQAADVRPRFDATVAAIRAERPALLRVSDLAAVEALFYGDPRRAARLSGRAASLAPDAVSRAHALATRATALAAAGDMPAARRCVARARRLAPGLHRVTTAAALAA